MFLSCYSIRQILRLKCYTINPTSIWSNKCIEWCVRNDEYISNDANAACFIWKNFDLEYTCIYMYNNTEIIGCSHGFYSSIYITLYILVCFDPWLHVYHLHLLTHTKIILKSQLILNYQSMALISLGIHSFRITANVDPLVERDPSLLSASCRGILNQDLGNGPVYLWADLLLSEVCPSLMWLIRCWISHGHLQPYKTQSRDSPNMGILYMLSLQIHACPALDAYSVLSIYMVQWKWTFKFHWTSKEHGLAYSCHYNCDTFTGFCHY